MLMDLDDDFFSLFLNIDDEESFADEKWRKIAAQNITGSAKCTESQLSSSVEIKTVQNSDVDHSTAQSFFCSDNGDHQISRSALLSSSVEIKTIQNSDVDHSTTQSFFCSDNGDYQFSRSTEDLERMFQDFIQVLNPPLVQSRQ
jgi:hypothetical protein